MKEINANALSTSCRTCRNMTCRSKGVDCYDVHDVSLESYQHHEENRQLALSASLLIDNGRAGTLDRVEELIAFARERGYTRIGVAGCFGMKNLVTDLCAELEEASITALPVLCTSGAVREEEIDPRKNTQTVSCNPAGQAEVFNRLKPDLVVEMGLCLGHDIIFHQLLNVPHTVLVVKDRKRGHAPATHFPSFPDPAERFLLSLDSTLAMKSPQWLAEQLQNETSPLIIDLRGETAFAKSRLRGSINMSIQELPKRIAALDRHLPTVCLCNGGIQSAYAVMFLSMRGFTQIYNLSGGFSRWERDGLPLDTNILSEIR